MRHVYSMGPYRGGEVFEKDHSSPVLPVGTEITFLVPDWGNFGLRITGYAVDDRKRVLRFHLGDDVSDRWLHDHERGGVEAEFLYRGAGFEVRAK